MKYLLTTAFFIVCLTAFAQNPIDGQWKGSVDTPDGPFEVNYTFKVEGKELKGKSTTSFGEIPLEKGKADGKKISYTISFNDMSIDCTGELINDNEILIKNNMGEIRLNRVK